MKSAIWVIVLAGILLLAAGPGMTGAQTVTYNGSVQYASGSYYFTEHTGSFYFQNGFGLTGDRLSLYMSIPFITQSTPWISYIAAGAGPLATGGPHNRLIGSGEGPGTRRGNRNIDPGSTDTLDFTRTRLGDPSLSGSLELYRSGFGRSVLRGTAGLKIPLTDAESGFGTGGWDAGAGLSWAQRLAGEGLLLVNAMYWKLGDMDKLHFKDILSYSAAVGRSFQNGKLMITASFLGTTQIIDDIDPPLNVGAGLGLQATTKVALNMNLLVGLTESASAFSAGAGWSISL